MFFLYKKQKIYYEKYGNGEKKLIILPGWGEVKYTYSFIMNHFEKDYTIYYFDYPGFGNSPSLNIEFEMNDYALMILSFLKKKRIVNPIILAHSFGGRIASLLLGKYQYFCQKLILVDVAGIKHFSFKIFFKKKIYQLLKILLYLFPDCKRSYFKEKLFHLFSSPDYQKVSLPMRKTFQNIVKKNLKNYYKSINCETLILWGKKDKDTPLKDASILHKMISNSGLVIYQKCGHFSYYELPYNTLLILDSFIKK
ncbi:MAG: alpha/beta hydrolase [Bacilli bacterium]|nr:alpha/beta hydrolase [Bacilli bacterium]